MGFLKDIGNQLISGAGSIASSAVGGIFGSMAQSSANKQNMKIAQMNNEYNERMLQKQMDYNSSMYERQYQDNLNMWNLNNQYNSASEQRKRLEAAGLNPSLMMNGGSAGIAQSMSAPSAQGINTPTATPYSVQPNTHMATALGSGFEKFLNSFMSYKMFQAQLKQVNIENQYKAAQILAEISDKHMSAFSKKAQGEFTQLQHSMYGSIVNSQLANDQVDREAKTIGMELDKQRIKTETYNALIRQKEFESYDENFKQTISETLARIALLQAQGRLTRKQFDTEIEQGLLIAANRSGINLDNKFKYRTLDDRIKAVAKELGLMEFEKAGSIISPLLGVGAGFAFGRMGKFLDKPKNKIGF